MKEESILNMIREVLRDELKGFATKEDLDRFATKEDLDRFATKEDLDRFATKEDLDRFATKEDLILLRNDLAGRIEGIQRGVQMIFEQMGKEFWDLRIKLELYDFNYLVRQNDRLTAIYETLRQEQAAMGHALERQEKELRTLKEKIR